MKFSSWFLLAVFGLGLFISVAGATPLEDGDAGFWIRADAEKKLGEKWKMSLGEEIRFREHAGITYADTHVGASWLASKYFLMGADYLQVRQTRTSRGKDRWYWEARPRVYVTPQITIKGWKIEDRNMLEFRVKEQIRDSLRYRQQISVTAPWKWTRFKIQPTFFDELFFESHRRGLTENRLFAGVKVHCWKPFNGMIGYMRQTTKSSAGDWFDSNILVTTVKASF